MLLLTLTFIISKSLSRTFWAKFCPKIWSTLDWLKFCTEIGYHILILILKFIFSNFFSLIYLGEIWSQNLKFLKLTEIWYRGKWPYFSFIFFGRIWSQKWTSSNWLKFGTEVDDHVLISILMFIFSNFLFIHLFFGKFGPKIWSFSDWLKNGTEIDYLILISILMFIFSKFLSFIFSLGKFGPTKTHICQINWNMVQGYIVYAYFDFNVYYYKILFIHISGANLVPKSEVFQIDWTLVQRQVNLYLFPF